MTLTRHRQWVAVVALNLVALSAAASGARADTSTQAAPPEATPSHFGLNLSLGVLLASGYRGQLWQPAQPTYDVTILYWITSHLTVGLEGSQATDSYASSGVSGGRVDVGVTHLEFNSRVYGDLHTLAPAMAFISPFVTVGGGAYLESQNSALDGGLIGTQDLEPGMSVGAGLKFTVIPQSVAFEILGRWDSVRFKDSATAQAGLPNLSGQLFSLNGGLSVLF